MNAISRYRLLGEDWCALFNFKFRLVNGAEGCVIQGTLCLGVQEGDARLEKIVERNLEQYCHQRKGTVSDINWNEWCHLKLLRLEPET